VLSIGKVSRGQVGYYTRQVARGDGVRAAGYYQREEEAPGRWTGRGAAALELTGELVEGQLEALLEGRHPETGEQLAARAPRQTLALDLTFSAPKSVSVLGYCLDAATHRQVTAAHWAAVEAALAWLEAEAAVVRRGHAGAQQHLADGLVAARFDHATSRDLDPQLHSHVLVSTLAQGPDGRLTQLHARQLYRCAATAGHLYQATLRQQLTARLGVVWQPVVKGQAEITGMAGELLGEFSSRRQAIEAEQPRILARAEKENRARAARGEAPLPLPHGRGLWEQATLASRSAKDRDAATDLSLLVPAWQARARPHGLKVYDPGAVLSDLRAHARGGERFSWERLAGELAGPDGLTRDKAWVDRRDVIQAIAANLHRLQPGTLRAGETAAAAAVRLADDWCAEQVALHTPGRAAQETERWALRYTTQVHLARERHLIQTVLARQGETGTAVASADVVARLTAELTLTGEQAAAVRALSLRGAGVDVLAAPAGAGKSYLTGAARAAWEQAGFSVLGTSTAAKAVRELADGAGISDARTVASLLVHLDSGYRIEDTTGEDGRTRRVRVPWALTSRHVLVVDEAAMCSTRDLARLVQACAQAGAKLVLIGDPAQLPSIQAGGAMATAMRQLDTPSQGAEVGQGRTIRLTSTVRAHADWEREAQLAWRDGNPASTLRALESHDRVRYGSDELALRADLVAAWAAHRAQLHQQHRADCGQGTPPEPLMVAHRRSQVAALNAAARQTRIDAGELDTTREAIAVVDVGGTQGRLWVPMAVGEPVITTVADRTLGVINGTRGVVTDVHAGGAVTVRTEAGAAVRLGADYLAAGGLLHSYALSGHRSQGSTAPVALVLADTGSMTREWGYSAMTRGRQNHLWALTEAEPSEELHPRGPRPDPAAPNQAATMRAALLTAMARPSGQTSALDEAFEQGLDLLAPQPSVITRDALLRVPTPQQYDTAARIATITAHRQGRAAPDPGDVDVTAEQLAARSAAQTGRAPEAGSLEQAPAAGLGRQLAR